MTSAIGASGGVIELISAYGQRTVCDVVVAARDETLQRSIVERVGAVDDIAILACRLDR